jgi:hypothetical protein
MNNFFVNWDMVPFRVANKSIHVTTTLANPKSLAFEASTPD